MNRRAVFTIVRKDLLDAIKNKHVLFSLLLPIIMSFLMRLVYLSQESEIRLAIFDPGGSQLVTRLTEGDTKVELIACASPEEVRLKVQQGADAGLVVPEDFDFELKQGRKPPVHIYRNARQLERVNWLEGFVKRNAYALAGYELPVRLQVDWLGKSGQSLDIGERISRFLLGMWLLMAAAIVGVIAVPGIMVEEKEKRTLDAILITPASYADVIVAKGLVGFIYAVMVSGIVLTLNDGFKGNVPLLLAGVLLTVLFTIGVGLFMSQFFNSVMQINTWSTVIFFPIIIPAMFFSLPPSVERVFRIFPTYYSARVFQLAWKGDGSTSEALLCLGVLAIWAVAFAVADVWMVKVRRRL